MFHRIQSLGGVSLVSGQFAEETMYALHDMELACLFSRPCLGLLVHGRRLRIGSLGPPKPPKPSLSENVKVVPGGGERKETEAALVM